jgi:hypothetical protein
MNIHTPPYRSHSPIVRLLWQVLLVVAVVLTMAQNATAQTTPFPPPRQIQVYNAQGLGFGSFYTGGTGGTVVVSPAGVRTSTGSVVLVGGMPQAAMFIVELLPGRLVNIMLGPSATLTRMGGGGSMTMTIGPTDKGASFVTSGGQPFRNPVMVGGTLFVGNTASNPAGSYEGSFSVTFIQE